MCGEESTSRVACAVTLYVLPNGTLGNPGVRRSGGGPRAHTRTRARTCTDCILKETIPPCGKVGTGKLAVDERPLAPGFI